jgi:endonuclease-8
VPEGDTIALTARALQQRLAGKRVLDARPERLRRLVGTTVEAAEPAGKHLFLRFDNGLRLHTHMRMRGEWHLYSPGERWQRPAHAAVAVLEVEDAVAVCFRAPVVELVRDTAAIAHLGPDVLSPAFDPAEAARRARALGSQTVGEALLDQRAAAGIGNVYRCEALWARRVSPFRELAGCSDGELEALFATARDELCANSVRSQARRFAHGRAAVYGRAGRPCPLCGTLIQARRLGEHARVAYWCPGCQSQ